MAMVRGVSAPPEAAVAAVGLRKVYGQGGTSVVALNDVDVTFPRGQFTAIMGPSGSGEVHPAALPGRTRHALRLSMISGRSQGLAGGAFVSAELARSYGLSVGERITVRWPRGGEGVRTVTGVYRGSSLVPGVLVPQQVALPHLEQTGASVAFVALAPRADQVAVRAGLERAVADRPDVVVRSLRSYLDQRLGAVDIVLRVSYALLALAVLVGLLGIGGGYLLGAMFQRTALRTGLFDASVPVGQLVLAVAGLAVVGMAAAAWPARRAARTNLLAAIAAE